MPHSDITIIGSGIVGAATAIALAQQIPALQITLIDAKPLALNWNPHQHDFRVSAISLASKRMLQRLGVWNSIAAKRISPYQKMHVWDESGAGEILFDRATLNVPALGYIIEDNVMRISLFEQFAQHKNICVRDNVELTALQKNADHVELFFAANETHQTKLLIAADGANSWVRAQTETAITQRDYEQTAIVATIKTTEPHQQTAWQRFLTTGPLAFLPCHDEYTCSIVWSALHERAAELLQLSDEEFCAQLSNAFEYKLGAVIEVSKRYSFPLQMRHVKNYVQNRLAFIGDAAHTLHPLAGQGVNLGLLDAACLAEVITSAHQNQRDFAAFTTLRRYERWRKADNFAMLTGVGLLKNLFIQQNKTIQTLRSTGLNLVNQFGALKNFFAAYGLGNRSDLPALARVDYFE